MSGNIHRRPNGRWRARYRDDAGKEHARHFERKPDAQRWLDEVTTSKVSGTYVDPAQARVTFRAFSADWTERRLWEDNTRESKGYAIASASALFGDLELGKIRRSSIEQWIKIMSSPDPQGRTLQSSTIRGRFRSVRAVFRAALADRMINVDPTEGVRIPAVHDQERRIPTPQEVAKLIEAADPGFGPFVALAAFAGMRLGEIAGLQLADVDFLRRSLRISRQVQYGRGGKIQIRPPKYGSARTIYLPDQLLVMLSRHVAHRGIAGQPDAWLFADDDRPLSANKAHNRWRVTCRRAGVSGVSVHGLRHFYATAMLVNGADPVTLQRSLGHRRPSTTLDLYAAHAWETTEDRAREAAARIMGAADQNLPTADSLRTAVAQNPSK